MLQIGKKREKIKKLDEAIMAVQEILETGHVWRAEYSTQVEGLSKSIKETADILSAGGYYIEVKDKGSGKTTKEWLYLNSENRAALTKQLSELTKTYDLLRLQENSDEDKNKIYVPITSDERRSYNETLEVLIKARIALTAPKDVPNWLNSIISASFKVLAISAGWVLTNKLLESGELDKQKSNWIQNVMKLF